MNIEERLLDSISNSVCDINTISDKIKTNLDVSLSKEINSTITEIKDNLDNLQILNSAFIRMYLSEGTGIKEFRDYLINQRSISIDNSETDVEKLLLSNISFFDSCLLSSILLDNYNVQEYDKLIKHYSSLNKGVFHPVISTDCVTLNLIDMTKTDNSIIVKNYLRGGFCRINVILGEGTSDYNYVYKIQNKLNNVIIKTSHEFMDTLMDKDSNTDHYTCSKNTYTLVLVEKNKSEAFKFSSIFDSQSSKVTHRFLSNRTATSNCGNIILL